MFQTRLQFYRTRTKASAKHGILFALVVATPMLASSLSRSYWHRERRPSLLRHCTDSATPPPGRRCGQQGNHHIRSLRMLQTPLQLCFVRTLLSHTWWSRLASLDEKLWPVAEYWILGLKPKPATTILLHSAATSILLALLLLYYCITRLLLLLYYYYTTPRHSKA